MPHVAIGSQGPRPVMPDEPAYAELGRIDPAGHGHGSYDIVPDRPVRLSRAGDPRHRRQRQRHDRPGHQHLPGRRRRRRNEWAAIDPGPALDAHVEAILAAAPGPITRIFATHTHNDHSPATVALQGAHRRHRARPGGAPSRMAGHDLRARRHAARRRAHRARAGHDAARRSTRRATRPTTSATCSRRRSTLFTGDHVMQMSTVVINPPDGDMRAYIASLRSLLDARPRLARARPRLPDGRAARRRWRR